jgi:CheY-like chemotaxis protein
MKETNMSEKLLTILLAEDDQDDRYLISEALDESGADSQLYVVETGEELLDYLRNQGNYTDGEKYPRPEVVLLDLNMPLMDGREALAEIKSDPELRRIPIIVLTTSQADEDVNETYALGITGFITKPMTFKGLVGIMKSVGNYWFQSVTLPSK